MKPETRSARERDIEAAAYALLEEKGYAGMSMLSVAKRAKCSNETMYKWYGDKLGLVRAMVSRNASEVKTLLQDKSAGTRPAMDTLTLFGPTLLQLLLSERAVALNRAAAADPTHELGKALASAGRDSVLPLLVSLMERAIADGALPQSDPARAVDYYLRLLIGDLQIRRVIGRLAPLSGDEIEARARSAIEALKKIL